jgi:uncharacterized protein involved in exopolysaccharide biosynthesis
MSGTTRFSVYHAAINNELITLNRLEGKQAEESKVDSGWIDGMIEELQEIQKQWFDNENPQP